MKLVDGKTYRQRNGLKVRVTNPHIHRGEEVITATSLEERLIDGVCYFVDQMNGIRRVSDGTYPLRRSAPDDSDIVEEVLQLEVGKTYADREGNRHTVTHRSEGAGTFLDGPSPFGWRSSWFEDGRKWRNGTETPQDLVAEAQPLTAVGDYIEWRKSQGIDDNATTRALVESEAAHPPAIEPKPEIPHADLIRAVLDGKVVQLRFPDEDMVWREYGARRTIGWLTSGPGRKPESRIKPEPVVKWCGLHEGAGSKGSYSIESYRSEEDARKSIRLLENGSKLLRIELDPDTLDVIHEGTRTEAP